MLRVAPHESSQKLTIRGTAPPEFPAASPMLLPAGGTCEDRLRTHTNIFVVPLDPGSAAYERWAVKPRQLPYIMPASPIRTCPMVAHWITTPARSWRIVPAAPRPPRGERKSRERFT